MVIRVLAVQRDNCWSLSSSKQNLPGEITNPYQVALAGFISNFLELEKRLGAFPNSALNPHHRLCSLLKHGVVECLEALKGNFAVLVHERGSSRLWARRDQLGGQSLYLARQTGNRGWVLGNSAADVFRISGQPLAEDPEYMAGFFSLYAQPLEGRTAFQSVQSLLPGELLSIEGSRLHRKRTPMPMAEPRHWTSEGEAIEQFRELLHNSISHCLAPEGDTAVMLSGGLDSGPITVLADRICQATNRRLLPISWSLNEFPEADESVWIDQLAQGLQNPLHRLESSQLLPFSNPDTAPVNPESPFYNPFRALLNRCYQTAAEHGCKVVLNGTDGDRIYPFYSLLYLGYVAYGEWGHLLEDLRESRRRGGWRAIWNKKPLHELLKQPLRPFVRKKPPVWLTPLAKRHWRALDTWPPECLEHPVPRYAEQVCGRRMTSGICEEYFQGCELGVERREPFHNEDLIAFMLDAPFSFTIRHHRTKWIMREAMQGLLPEAFRLKRRTGGLSSFYRAGKVANLQAIESLLFTQRQGWQRWANADAVGTMLADQRPGGPAAIMIERCIGYVNWLNYWQQDQARG